MDDSDPFRTHHQVLPFIADELHDSGFDDVHEIGHGGFGVVYRCTQTALDRIVAVKVLTTDLDDDNRARFFREQRAMGRLTGHPNIVEVFEVGATASGRPYLVMPYYPHNSLDAQIRRHGALTEKEVLRLGVKTAGALETAHRAGIVHRDVKPANILLTDYEEPVLADFGIAHIAGAFRTATGTVTGSPAFTAPEVLSGDSPTVASDVYGLGATLFTALTGHAAYERRSGEQVVAQFLRITTQPVPDLRVHGYSEEVSVAIERAMSRSAADRPSAAVFGNLLQQVQTRHGFTLDEMALRAEPSSSGQGSSDRTWRDSPDNSPLSAPQPPPDSQHLPAGPTGGGRKTNLPLDLTSFVGRRAELAEVRKLLSTSRLVTLTGIGGVGKTRLALRVADTLGRAFPDGLWLVELGELRDGQLLTHMVATALGVRHEVTGPLPVLTEYLAAKNLLLILDNCEHVISAAAELTIALLRSCPGLKILTTSREPLGIGGESVLRVPPLKAPDLDYDPPLASLPQYEAVNLFVERAARAVPSFELTEDNHVAVARICRRLDGLPLALELAAARLRVMSPDQILQRLNDRYALLTRGARGVPSRQQTLRWSIDWSHNLCTQAEQQMWARLSVFAGAFDLDAATHMLADTGEPEELLEQVTSLVDKSILIREESDTGVRFRMLETLRDYGRERLQDAGEHQAMRSRHRDWYRQMALDAESEWISPRQLDWIARLNLEQPNLREALEFSLSVSDGSSAGLDIAAALFPFWFSHGLLTEGRRWLERALAGDEHQSAALRVKGLYAASILATRQRDLQEAIALIEQGRMIADEVGTARDRALIQRADGYLALHRGDPRRAVTFLSQALDEFRRDGDLMLQIMTLHGLGLAHHLLGQPDQAVARLEDAIQIAQSHGESASRGRSSWTLALVVWQQDNRDRAVSLLRDGLELARLSDDPSGAAWCLELLAWIAATERHFHRAGVLMAAAAALRRKVGTSVLQIPNLTGAHQECERTTREGLGPRGFTAACREGESMSFGSAISYAREEKPSPRHADASSVLTKRENQVAALVAKGLTNREIATQLVISPRTAQGHVEHVLTKLGFTSRAQIAAWAVEQTLLTESEGI
ncbi:protein kinase [Rhodococcus sp. ACS1]|uniref:protein kinase domain-containing protein n=1 Tax=Rhodococcus sp. ACS1 TaxID=2028570 RepID=UPI000BB11246|nr:protein kinase [Rhodococcus sp. ACS1]PBC52044.1 protein kinase [Rhodococcus sp. ACS1]